VRRSFGTILRGVGVGVAFLAACGQSTTPAPAPLTALQTHSGPLAVNPDGSLLFVVHPDADSVSAIDPRNRSIVWQTLLAVAPPAVASAGYGCSSSACTYTPNVMPRALALDPTGTTLYVTGERNGTLGALPGVADSSRGLVYALDASTGTVLRKSAPVCAEPAGILVDSTGTNLYVACSNDDLVAQLRASDLSVVTRVPCLRKPWALGWAPDVKTLLVTHLLGLGGADGGVSPFTTSPLALGSPWIIPALPLPLTAAPTTPNGSVRAVYDAVPRPGSSEIWVPHALLSTTTKEPTLAFNTTAFPAIAVLDTSGDLQARLTVSTEPGDGNAFGDIVSGPRSIAFSPDGRYAFVVDAHSEDVLVVDARARAEATLVRPLPGHMPEGIVFSPDGKVYVMQRNTEDIAVLDVVLGDEEDAGGDGSVGMGLSVVVESTTIPTLSNDPMPSELRLGQQLFHSANSDEIPITQNHWIACATCHVEERTDVITWSFTVGPRDTPSNAGGVLGTGFLMHTAERREVADYWLTINAEQGGDFHNNPTQEPLLLAIQDYVNFAVPIPVPPTTDPTLVAQGREVFASSGCPTCHSSAGGTGFKTDSGCGNPTLDLHGPEVSTCKPGGVLVHDVGTCNPGPPTTPYGDQPQTDMDGDPRNPCAFDTPALRGLWDAAPYMHDGRAATLDQAVGIMLVAASKVGGPTSISASDRQALVEYLKSL
jgi:DNA-binding beta-propeller fold protein YncE